MQFARADMSALCSGMLLAIALPFLCAFLLASLRVPSVVFMSCCCPFQCASQHVLLMLFSSPRMSLSSPPRFLSILLSFLSCPFISFHVPSISFHVLALLLPMSLNILLMVPVWYFFRPCPFIFVCSLLVFLISKRGDDNNLRAQANLSVG